MPHSMIEYYYHGIRREDIPRMKTKSVIANIFLPLLIGLVIYVLCRPDTIITHLIRSVMPAIPDLSDCMQINTLTRFINNYACDILWSYALTFCVALCVRSTQKVLIVCSLFCCFIETVQLCNLFALTFDFFDITVEVITVIIGLLVIKIFKLIPMEA